VTWIESKLFIIYAAENTSAIRVTIVLQHIRRMFKYLYAPCVIHQYLANAGKSQILPSVPILIVTACQILPRIEERYDSK